jgi:hypothetical protein
LALQQDFGAKILADNLYTLLSDLDLPRDDECVSRPNRVYAIGALKPIPVRVFCVSGAVWMTSAGCLR